MNISLRVFIRAVLAFGGPFIPKWDHKKAIAKRYLYFLICQFSPAGHLEVDSRLDKLSILLNSTKSGFFEGSFL